MKFSILMFDEPDSAALRDEYRQRHLDYLKRFEDQTLFAGPFTTDDESADLGSLRLVEFPSREAAVEHVEREPYVIGGVQKRWHIHRWEASTPFTWRDCPRTEGNIQVLLHALDRPGAGTLRAELTAVNLAYLQEHRDAVMARGPLLSDDGERQVGSVYLFDVRDMDAARKLKDTLPFARGGLYQDVVFNRWRFGRVFDRFKV